MNYNELIKEITEVQNAHTKYSQDYGIWQGIAESKIAEYSVLVDKGLEAIEGMDPRFRGLIKNVPEKVEITIDNALEQIEIWEKFIDSLAELSKKVLEKSKG